jgi:hypothetical protein
MAEKSGPRTRQTNGKKLGLVWRNRKKIGQIINAYLSFPFFIFIILCPHPLNRQPILASSPYKGAATLTWYF